MPPDDHIPDIRPRRNPGGDDDDRFRPKPRPRTRPPGAETSQVPQLRPRRAPADDSGPTVRPPRVGEDGSESVPGLRVPAAAAERLAQDEPHAPAAARTDRAAERDDFETTAEYRASVIAAEHARSHVWRSAAANLAVGLIITALFIAFPFTRWVVDILTIILHELGHAAVSWSFGYPAIPALDLHHGGGLTPTFDRKLLLAIGAAALFLLIPISQYKKPHRLGLGIAAFILYAILALTTWHQALILAMGHGMVMLISAVFLVRGLAGIHLVSPLERPLYIALGLIMPLREAYRFWMLIDNLVYRQHFIESKGGVVIDDLTRLSFEYFSCDFATIAAAGLVAAIATIIISVVIAAATLVFLQEEPQKLGPGHTIKYKAE